MAALCSLCLCGECLSAIIHHRVTENTEVAQSDFIFLDRVLKSAIQPTGNWITSLVKHKAEKISAGLFDHFLSSANLIAACLARGNYDSDAIYDRRQCGGV